MNDSKSQQLLIFFKALADANRLKIVGLLAQEDHTVEEIASLLELHPSTVSHHLSKLAKAGLVSARAESYYSIYTLETKRIESMAKNLLQSDSFSASIEDIDLDAYDRKVLRAYMDAEGRFKSLPTQQKKLDVLLRHVVKDFDPDARYTEKQVNEIISRYTDDISGVRRDLIDHKYLARQTGGREYWKL